MMVCVVFFTVLIVRRFWSARTIGRSANCTSDCAYLSSRCAIDILDFFFLIYARRSNFFMCFMSLLIERLIWWALCSVIFKEMYHTSIDTLEIEMTCTTRHVTLRWYFRSKYRISIDIHLCFEKHHVTLWIWSWMSNEICQTHTLIAMETPKVRGHLYIWVVCG